MIDFNGEVTEEFRNGFIRRRRELGLSQSQAAARLKVSWLTIRNWEMGKIGHCRAGVIPRIRLFLEEEVVKKEKPCPAKKTRSGREMAYCRLLSLYDSLMDFPHLQSLIGMQLKVAIRQAIAVMEKRLVREMGIEPILR